MFDIITDSACDLTLDTAKQLGIEVVPFYVSLDGEHYRKEGLEIPVRDFYQFMVDNPAAYPKTSLASIEDFEKTFRAHAEAGRAVLCLVFTGKMSGCVAAPATPGIWCWRTTPMPASRSSTQPPPP